MVQPGDLLPVGRFGRTYGVGGWNWVHSLAGAVCDLVFYGSWYLRSNESYSAIALASKRLVGDRLRVQVQGCLTVEQAQGYVNRVIYVPKCALLPLQEGEYYWHELIGLEVFGLDGYLGVVQELFSAGVHDVLVVTKDSCRILIPYVDAVVKNVSLSEQRMDVEWASDYL